MKTVVLLIAILLSMACANHRVIVLSDISAASQEPDDLESMVRLMVYSNELDIEGLIATSSCWRKNDPLRPDLIDGIIEAYREVRSNLSIHASGYPSADSLLNVVRSGNTHGMAAVGSGKSSPGSDLIAQVVDAPDERPLWICIWGGAATLAQTLYDVRESRTSTETAEFVRKLRVYDLSGQDDAGAWICHTFPDIFYIRSRVQWRGFSYRLDNQWNDSRGPDEDMVSPAWFSENISTSHGALGAMYPPAKYLHEGDTPTFLNLLDNGLSSEPDSIHFGGWGGRFDAGKQENVRTGSDNATVVESEYDDYRMFTDAVDRWQGSDNVYENTYCALFRWRVPCQNDFAVRMDWCMKSFEEANHHPVAVVNGEEGTAFIRIDAQLGSTITLDASESYDPDSDELNVRWWIYPEAGTYDGEVMLDDTAAQVVTIAVPADCAGKTFHVILTLRDNGVPQLYSYRRIIITGKQPAEIGISPDNRGTHCSVKNSHEDNQMFLLNGRMACQPRVNELHSTVIVRRNSRESIRFVQLKRAFLSGR